MDDSIPDIYGDLDKYDFTDELNKFEERNDELTKQIDSLTNKLNALLKESTVVKSNQENLKRNISELFKTAKAEIGRKDRIIAELRKQIDDILFKRNEMKRPISEEISEQKLVENKRPRLEQSQERYERVPDKREKSYEKSYHRRDYRDRDRNSHHYSASSRRDDLRKYEHKDDFRGTKYAERRSQDNNKKYTDNKISDRKGRNSKTRDIKDGKENNFDMNAKSVENKYDSDGRIAKVDVKKIENAVNLEENKDTKKIESVEIEEGEIEDVEIIEPKKLERKIVDNAKSEKVLKKEASIEKEKSKDVIEIEPNKITDTKNISNSNEIIMQNLKSTQELQNAINSIKNESNEETINEETLQSVVDPNDSAIITQGNCIKLTNNCNKSFRSRRKRVVITVTD